MPIDFDVLVLAPCMNTFARPVSIAPIVSRPHVASYDARGVWEVTEVDIITEDGGTLSNRTLKLGIRMSEFAVVPKQGDWVTTKASDLPLAYWGGREVNMSAIINDLVVDDVRPDGQGGAKLVLKRIKT